MRQRDTGIAVVWTLFFFLWFGMNAFAQPLELEVDPDEAVGALEISGGVIGGEEVKRVQNDVQQVISDLQTLLGESQERVLGIEEVSGVLESDVKSLDWQGRLMKMEGERFVVEVRRLIEEAREHEGELELLRIQQKLKESEISDAFGKLQDIVGLLYSVRRSYTDLEGRVNPVSLLVGDGKVSDLFLKERYLRVVQHQAEELLRSNAQKYAVILQSQELLRDDLADLRLLISRMVSAATVMAQQQAYGEELLARRERGAAFFAGEMERAQAEQVKIQREIQRLVRELTQQEFELQTFSEGFIWPVEPTYGLSARFDDAEYYERFSIPHKAIDIPTEQLTPVKAIADGIVGEVRDGGVKGYSYVLVLHDGKVSSLYGHVFEFLVEKGDVVRQGDIIALSGGAPGTHGAGPLTTGAHVHLEIWRNGEAVDPLPLLPQQ